MSRHRVKAVAYDEDDFDDDGYDSPDPEEQEFLEQCTAEVLSQLLAGSPSVTATRDEVQEALWHYYNDVEKSVNYLRSEFTKTVQMDERVFLFNGINRFGGMDANCDGMVR